MLIFILNKPVLVNEQPAFEIPCGSIYKQLSNQLIVQSYGRTLKITDPTNGRVVETRSCKISICSIHELRHGIIVLADEKGNATLVDSLNVKRCKKISIHSGVSDISVFVTKNEEIIAYNSLTCTVKVWNVDTKLEPTLLCEFNVEQRLRWNMICQLTNGYLVLLYSEKGFGDFNNARIHIWNPKDGRLVKQIDTGIYFGYTCCVLPDNQIAISDKSGTIRIVNLTDELPYTLINVGRGVSRMIPLPNDHLLLIISNSIQSCLKIVNCRNGELVQTINTYEKPASGVSLSLDSRRLLLVRGGKEASFWELNV